MAGGEAARIRTCGGVMRGWLESVPPFSWFPRFLGMSRDHVSVKEVDVQITTPIVEARKDVLVPNKIERLSRCSVPSISQFSATWGRP